MRLVNYKGLIRTKEVFVAENWNELTGSQLLMTAKIWGPIFLSATDVPEKVIYSRKMLMLRKFLKMSWFRFVKTTSGEFVDLLQLISWIHQPIDLNTQVLPVISVRKNIFSKKQKFHGPKAGLRTSCFDEFILADTHFINISSKKSWDHMYELVATLYRPMRADVKEHMASEDWDGDIREPFNVEKIKDRAAYFKKHMSFDQALAVTFFYWGFRNTCLLKYHLLFPKPKEGAVVAENKYGWGLTRMELSGGKFGDYKNTGKTNWKTIVFEMHITEEKRIKEERRQAQLALRNKHRK